MRRFERAILICVSLGWFLVLAGRLSISALLVNIEDSLHIGHAEAGLALTGMWFLYALMQFPSGLASDIRGRKVSILLAMMTFSLSYLLIGLSINYIMFFMTLLLLGAGGGSYPTVGIAMITDVFREKRGRALGIQSSAGSLAGIVPIFASIVALYFDWHLFFFILAIASLFSTYLFFKYTGESTKLPVNVSIKERFFEGIMIFKDKEILLIFIVNLALTFAWLGYMSFFPTYLIEGKMFSQMEASIALAVLTTAGIFLKPLVGEISDIYNKKMVLSILILLSALATLLLVYAHSIAVVLVISFTLAFTSASFPIISSYLIGRWEEKGRGGKLGFYRTMVILTGSPTSAIIGISAGRYGFDVPFLAIALILFVASVVIFSSFIKEKC